MSKLKIIRRRVDQNQAEIVKGLRDYGFSVQHLHTIGKGCPDLLVGIDGKNYLIELKKDSRSKLTEDEFRWAEKWKGQVIVAHNLERILELLT